MTRITPEELARIRAAAIGDMLGDPKALDELGPSAVIFRLCSEVETFGHEAADDSLRTGNNQEK